MEHLRTSRRRAVVSRGRGRPASRAKSPGTVHLRRSRHTSTLGSHDRSLVTYYHAAYDTSIPASDSTSWSYLIHCMPRKHCSFQTSSTRYTVILTTDKQTSESFPFISQATYATVSVYFSHRQPVASPLLHHHLCVYTLKVIRHLGFKLDFPRIGGLRCRSSPQIPGCSQSSHTIRYRQSWRRSLDECVVHLICGLLVCL